MIKTHMVKKEVEQIKSITCNKCGGNCKSKDSKDGFYCLSARVKGHFYSDHLEDGQEYRFDICEQCLLKLFKTFKVPVEKDRYPLSEG
jgi:ssDNA-binding Zn-finger/Zn-ribbon topoisomerase 1